jgi:hypothetical protein
MFTLKPPGPCRRELVHSHDLFEEGIAVEAAAVLVLEHDPVGNVVDQLQGLQSIPAVSAQYAREKDPAGDSTRQCGGGETDLENVLIRMRGANAKAGATLDDGSGGKTDYHDLDA